MLVVRVFHVVFTEKLLQKPIGELDFNIVFSRTVLYGLENYPEKNKEEQWERFNHHINEK